MQDYRVDKYNLFNMIFIKNKKNYSLLIKEWDTINGKSKLLNKKILLRTPKMKIPFGIEKYFFKEIINLEFSNVKKNNEMHNFLSIISQIDNFMTKLSWNNNFHENMNLNENIISDLKNKKYLSCIKNKENFDPLLRTHLFQKGNNIATQFFIEDEQKNKSFLKHSNEIKGKYGYFILEINSLWIHNDTYGLTWILKAGKLVDN